MKLARLLEVKENEKPLDYIVEDGGYVGIFRSIACIGDSLSSGEFEAVDLEGNHSWHDFFDYSWGQYIARDAGVKVYNFSRGGMSCKEYMESFAQSIDAFSENKKCEAYIIALGVNDLFNDDVKIKLGKIDDLENKEDSMSRYYQEIILKYKEIQPHAKFFLLTMANENDSEEDTNIRKAHRDLIYQIAKKYSKTYVIDLYQYGPKYDEKFKEKFYLNGHMNPAGYRLSAKLIESYIDFIIRQNFKDFSQVGFIGKEQYRTDLD